ncbi:MAG TPA: arginine--tRNA ligase [Thermoplasmata archaeon]|nr:arginine--tRNA ligase [Thermoplasmata archaeon]
MSSASDPPSESFDPLAPFVEAATRGIASALASLGLGWSADQVLAQLDTDGGEEGDFAFPVHRAAAEAHRPAEEFAGALARAFPADAQLLPPRAKGAYLNVAADPRRLTEATLGLVLGRRDRYGRRERAGPATCVEHTSANPTGPFHIGRVRNAIIGDTLARIVRASGAAVTTQYYVDDMGRQAALISWIWSKPRDQWPAAVREAVDGHEEPGEKPDRRWGRPYPAASAYLKEHADAQAEVAARVQQIESGAPPPDHRQITQQILDGMLASLARLDIHFDEFVWESDFLRDGSVERVLERLRQAPHAVREDNGAWAIDAAGYGLPKATSRVIFQRGNGTSLYVTRDVAYHLAKFARFASLIDVLGQDHQLHARTLNALLAEVGEARRPTYLVYQDITVPEGGRMSTRKGSAVWLDQLIEEAVERARREVRSRREDLLESDLERIAEAVATGAIRYHIARVAPEKPVAFRWEDALSFEGRSGPFLQYAYARASSVLRKAEQDAGPFPFDAGRLTDPEEAALVRILARFPSTVARAARSMHVQSVAGYAHELADRFNRFYHAVPVLRSGEERASRIALVAAVRQALGNALDLLGVARLETM